MNKIYAINASSENVKRFYKIECVFEELYPLTEIWCKLFFYSVLSVMSGMTMSQHDMSHTFWYKILMKMIKH